MPSTSAAGPPDPSADLSTVLGKAVTILRSFGPEDHVLSLAELVRRTGLHKATVHRLARELVATRLLDRLPDGYRLSGGLFELGMRASVERSLIEVAMPFLQDLSVRTRETVHLGVRDGLDVVYVAKVGGHGQVATQTRIGGRMPLHCTGLGKVLLAHAGRNEQRAVLTGPLVSRTRHTVVAAGLLRRQLRRIAETGTGFDFEESSLGVCCVAAPVLGADGRAQAALSVTGPTARFRPEQHADVVRAAAAALGATLIRRDSVRGPSPTS